MARHQPHLLVDLPLGDGAVVVDGETKHHLEKVLRLSEAEVTYTDGAGRIGSGVYSNGYIQRGVEELADRPGRLTVAVAPPNSNSRVRFVVEKLGELGVTRLVWLRTNYGQGRSPKPEKAARWVRGALEQSRGAWLMDVAGSVDLDDLAALGTPVFASAAGRPIGELNPVPDPVLCIGPEGGFAPMEIPEDALAVNLGATILRVETAAIVGVAMLRERWAR